MLKNKFWGIIFSNFFLIILISRLIRLSGVDFNLQRYFQLFCFFYGLSFLFYIKKKFFDVCVVIYLIYILFNVITISYTNQGIFLYYAFCAQISSVFCYFIGRGCNYDIESVLKSMKLPLIFSVIVGIYLFFFPSSWYLAMKTDRAFDESNVTAVMEIFRLSSFWSHPYQIGYSSFLYSSYLIYILFTKQIKNKLSYWAILFLLIICLLLAQLRVTIVLFIFCFIYVNLKKEDNNFSKKINFLLSGVGLLLIVFVITSHLNEDLSNYIYEHIMQLSDSGSYSERFELISGGIKEYSLLGEGFGKYGYLARDYGYFSIVDSEFQRQLTELGYVGVSILGFLLTVTVIRLIFNQNQILNTVIFVFFVVAMVGASVLSNEHQYNYIFWFVVGQIWRSHERTFFLDRKHFAQFY